MNRPTALRPDLCVIGAGAAGLTVAAGASQMGASVVLIEKGDMGGDCLNVGCVPSKALIAAGAAAQAARDAGRFGVHLPAPEIDFAAVMRHVHGVIDEIAPVDSQERFEGLGVTVLRDPARFLDGRTVAVGGRHVRARRFVVATGSRPLVPPVPGLEAVPYLTNETVFGLTERPEALLILGGGPIGCELAQAFRRLGSTVTVIEMSAILGRDDPDLSAVVRDRLVAEGVDLREGWRATSVSEEVGRIRLHLSRETDGAAATVEGSHLLIAVGRQPVTDGLHLDAAGIAHTPRGITVDDGLRTSNRRVYAIGDVTGGPQFTHVAGYHGALVLKSALFRLPVKASATPIPHVTYTDPELAAVGLSEAAARAIHGDSIRVLRWPYADNDRARTERATAGLVKATVDRKGRVLGAAVVGRHAGEVLAPWIVAVHKRLKVGALATMVAPYPTLSETTKRAAGSYFTPTLFSERTRRLVRLLARLG